MSRSALLQATFYTRQRHVDTMISIRLPTSNPGLASTIRFVMGNLYLKQDRVILIESLQKNADRQTFG
jgi:hypothetical protein